jgi:hypothetical protein
MSRRGAFIPAEGWCVAAAEPRMPTKRDNNTVGQSNRNSISKRQVSLEHLQQMGTPVVGVPLSTAAVTPHGVWLLYPSDQAVFLKVYTRVDGQSMRADSRTCVLIGGENRHDFRRCSHLHVLECGAHLGVRSPPRLSSGTPCCPVDWSRTRNP